LQLNRINGELILMKQRLNQQLLTALTALSTRPICTAVTGKPTFHPAAADRSQRLIQRYFTGAFSTTGSFTGSLPDGFGTSSA